MSPSVTWGYYSYFIESVCKSTEILPVECPEHGRSSLNCTHDRSSLVSMTPHGLCREANRPLWGRQEEGVAGQPGPHLGLMRPFHVPRSHSWPERLAGRWVCEEPVMRVQSQGSGMGKLDGASPNYCWGSAGSRGAWLMEGREGRAPKMWWCGGS